MTSELRELVERARLASPNDRIELRDPIATYGTDAVDAMAKWLADPVLTSIPSSRWSGNLAGAWVGAEALGGAGGPWRAELEYRDEIIGLADKLLELIPPDRISVP